MLDQNKERTMIGECEFQKIMGNMIGEWEFQKKMAPRPMRRVTHFIAPLFYMTIVMKKETLYEHDISKLMT